MSTENTHDTGRATTETINEHGEHQLYSRRDHWSEEYRQAVENGFEGSEDAFWELKDQRERGIQENAEALGREISELSSIKGSTMAVEEARLEALETEVDTLKQQLSEIRKEQTVVHSQFLMMLGDMFFKQGQHIYNQAIPPTTLAKIVPQEEKPNESTMKVILDDGVLVLYRVVDNTLVPHQDSAIDQQVVIDKLNEFAIVDGTMVNMNIYLSRG